MEQKESDDARYSELLTPTKTPVQSEDDDTKGTGASPDGEKSPATVSQGTHWREAYCLLVRVTHNVDSVSVLDAKGPDYVWTKVIAWDICTFRIGAPSGTFVVELLSDTEFLLFERPPEWSRDSLGRHHSLYPSPPRYPGLGRHGSYCGHCPVYHEAIPERLGQHS